MQRCIKKLFGGLNLTWPKTIIFAIIMGVYTALVAMLVPDGNSFHDIAVTLEWWVLPAIIIITNCKKPLEAAAKTFAFFLISQPLVYLLQVPFSPMGWGLFGYYPYWFGFTVLTFPAAFICWFIRKDKWYSGLILACATVLLGLTAVAYISQLQENFPDHLVSIIYCLGTILLYIFVLLKNKLPRILCAAITTIAIVIYGLIAMMMGQSFEAYNGTVLKENDISFIGEPFVSSVTSEGSQGGVEIIKYSDDDGDAYNLKLSGSKSGKYRFTISDDENSYDFEYYFDNKQQTVIITKL